MIISFGQALLLLLKKQSRFKEESEKDTLQEKLKKIYLIGVSSEEEKDFVLRLFKEDSQLSAQYAISLDFSVTNEDPTRRYFETHLAFKILAESIDKIKPWQLIDCTNNQLELSHSNEKLDAEYTYYVSKIKKSPAYEKFISIDKGKLTTIQKLAYYGMGFNDERFKAPLEIYHNVNSFFPECNRGRYKKKHCIKSRNLGILKSYMPLPKNDIALEPNNSERGSIVEKYNYQLESAWIKKIAPLLVHPFVSSISGTTLSQLRAIKHLKNNNKFNIDYIDIFFKIFSSLMLFNTSGHSYYEIFHVFQLDEVREAFSDVQYFEKISMLNLLYLQNKNNFDAALKETIQYNDIILDKRKVHIEITNESHYQLNSINSNSRIGFFRANSLSNKKEGPEADSFYPFSMKAE